MIQNEKNCVLDFAFRVAMFIVSFLLIVWLRFSSVTASFDFYASPLRCERSLQSVSAETSATSGKLHNATTDASSCESTPYFNLSGFAASVYLELELCSCFTREIAVRQY